MPPIKKRVQEKNLMKYNIRKNIYNIANYDKLNPRTLDS